MELHEVFDRTSCDIRFRARTKEEAMRRLAGLACRSRRVEGFTPEEIYAKISAREAQGSTGFGGELAIPHARVEGMKEFLLFAVVAPRGVEFEALDKKRVRLLFVILGPAEEVNEHLKILASVSRMVGNPQIRRELLGAPSVTSLYESFVRHARIAAAAPGERRKMKLLTVILYLDELLDDILEFFIEEGVEGATVIESFGMGEYISNIPLFADFIGFMQKNKNQSKTVMALVPENRVDRLVEGVEEITGDLDKKQGAMVFTLEVPFYKGTMKML